MDYNLKGRIDVYKRKLKVSIILWFILIIVFVAPFCYGLNVANINGSFDLATFVETFSQNIYRPGFVFSNIFSNGLVHSFISCILGFTVVYTIAIFVGLSKTKPKGEYANIEYGSSDWCQKGEQYRILSKTEGIILAKDNYLPLDKRGNTNVLVVGRIRCW